ncbi:glycosyltransferase [Robiginitalea sp. M366]|uniref:glycosyltransferase n=1 Tax=Robiginitalea aestuariiviva TaxID=3036903 RepID=UPI00240D861F|nr:glycosyltransferase [Robiginitalea aestuariiviva]MDG1571393.1 glycosyltransferase [Robiginitalea aestuariiviva]
MKILLTSLGTRGDMEPFLAVADLLRAAGHETVCLFPEQFRNLAEDGGHRFCSLGPEFMELLESPLGKTAMGGSGTTWQKIKAYAKLARVFAPMRRVLAQRQAACMEQEQPDRVVHHAKTIYGFVWGMQHPGQATLLSPVPYMLHPTNHHSHIAFNKNWGRRGNRASYGLANFGLVQSILSDTKKIPMPTRPTRAGVKDILRRQPTLYTISPALFKRPPYWPPHVQVLGYQERNKTRNWTPPPELVQWLEGHPKVLFVTFGSMTNPEPARKTEILLSTLERLGIPALINTAGGGLVVPGTYDTSLFYFVDGIPYDWALPRVYAMVHHGGSGTTHLGVKYGCPSLVIPHIIDQFMWNRLLAEQGLGPKGPGITRLSKARLLPLLKDLWENPAYHKQAAALGAEMAKEDFSEPILKAILG